MFDVSHFGKTKPPDDPALDMLGFRRDIVLTYMRCYRQLHPTAGRVRGYSPSCLSQSQQRCSQWLPWPLTEAIGNSEALCYLSYEHAQGKSLVRHWFARSLLWAVARLGMTWHLIIWTTVRHITFSTQQLLPVGQENYITFYYCVYYVISDAFCAEIIVYKYCIWHVYNICSKSDIVEFCAC